MTADRVTEARKIAQLEQILTEETQDGPDSRRQLLAQHHRAVFALYYQREVEMTQFRSCLCTHGFLLRLLAADKGLSCIKFFKAKNPGVLFIDETSELEVGAFLSLTATFPQAVCLLDSGQTMSKANSTKLQLDDEPTEVQTAELLKNTRRPESSGDCHLILFPLQIPVQSLRDIAYRSIRQINPHHHYMTYHALFHATSTSSHNIEDSSTTLQTDHVDQILVFEDSLDACRLEMNETYRLGASVVQVLRSLHSVYRNLRSVAPTEAELRVWQLPRTFALNKPHPWMEVGKKVEISTCSITDLLNVHSFRSGPILSKGPFTATVLELRPRIWIRSKYMTCAHGF